jgi:hypothetical protein
MPVSLHAVSVGTYLQILPAIAGLLDKAEEHCREGSHGDEALTGCQLAEDMWPLAKQVTSVIHHSAGAINGLRAGVFSPDLEPAPQDFATLKQRVTDAIAVLQSVNPAEVDALTGGDMRFEFGPRRMDFTAEDFILTFSLPNFYFHAATVYNILRGQGLKIGKMDFMGRPRLKG